MQNDIITPGRDLVISNEQFTPTIEQMIAMWLSSVSPSGSHRTIDGYGRTIKHFRDELSKYGLDLDSDEVLVSACAQAWAAVPLDTIPLNHRTYPSLKVRREKLNGVLSAVTFNDRITVIASFYKFAARRRWMKSNPMEMVPRPKKGEQEYAKPIPVHRVNQVMASIDRSSFIGKRDFAILSVFFCCGRRRQEVVGLNWGDLVFTGEHTATLYFRRTKGNQQIKDNLPSPVVDAILDYLHEACGNDLSVLGADDPLWVGCSSNGYASVGERLGAKGMADIFRRHFGSGKTHAARHTLATLMDEQTDAKIGDIQAQLGHKHSNTTDVYLKRDRALNNKYTSLIAEMVGIDAPSGEEESSPYKGVSILDQCILAHPNLSNYAIAKLVGVSSHTVKKHREKLSSKS